MLSLQISANRPLRIENLPPSISSELEGNPPLWITKTKDGTEVYINNAKILMEYSNFVSKLKSQNGDVMTQVRKYGIFMFSLTCGICTMLMIILIYKNVNLLFSNEFTRCLNRQKNFFNETCKSLPGKKCGWMVVGARGHREIRLIASLSS